MEVEEQGWLFDPRNILDLNKGTEEVRQEVSEEEESDQR